MSAGLVDRIAADDLEQAENLHCVLTAKRAELCRLISAREAELEHGGFRDPDGLRIQQDVSKAELCGIDRLLRRVKGRLGSPGPNLRRVSR